MNARQQRFAEEYVIDLNAKQAAIRAGYSARSAEVTGCRLLSHPKVAAAIAEAKRERSETTKIDAEWVLRQAVELYLRCMQEIRPALHPKTRQQMKDEDGNLLFTFNAAAANRALELIGKHVGINAFRENVEVSGDVSLIERLRAGRARVRMKSVTDAEYREIPEPVPALPASRP